MTGWFLSNFPVILIYRFQGYFMWIIFALLSAFFAAATSILVKIGIQDINSNLATAIRTVVVLIMAWSIVFFTGKHNDFVNIGQKNLIFLILSGVATGLSWLCYYRALQLGEVSKVLPVDKFSLVIGMILAFIILKEAVTLKTIIGGVLITIGTFVLIF
jgi:transporter family protein